LAAAAIPSLGGVAVEFRIGDRDPVTGLYNVIYPDGSTTRNGLKIFNAAHQTGDLVLATQRSDGMMILDAAKAIDISSGEIDREIGVKEFGSKPVGYLAGQVFNNEEEEIPTLELKASIATVYKGDFTIITILFNRPIGRETRVYPVLTGTAVYETDYTIEDNPLSEDDEQIVGIKVNSQSISKTFKIKVSDSLDQVLTIDLKAFAIPRCRVKNNLSLATTPRTIAYRINRRDMIVAPTFGVLVVWSLPYSVASGTFLETTANIASYNTLWSMLTSLNVGSPIHFSNYTRVFRTPSIPAGFVSEGNVLGGNNLFRSSNTISGEASGSVIVYREDEYVI
jgi:hypothetical protein